MEQAHILQNDEMEPTLLMAHHHHISDTPLSFSDPPLPQSIPVQLLQAKALAQLDREEESDTEL